MCHKLYGTLAQVKIKINQWRNAKLQLVIKTITVWIKQQTHLKAWLDCEIEAHTTILGWMYLFAHL